MKAIASIVNDQRNRLLAESHALEHEVKRLHERDEALTCRLVKLAAILRTLNAYLNDGFLQRTGNADEDWDLPDTPDVITVLDREFRRTLAKLETIRKRIQLKERSLYKLECKISISTRAVVETRLV